MTLAYFCLASLSLLPASAISTAPEDAQRSALELMIKDESRKEFIDWVYERQEIGGGFRGGSSMDGTEMGSDETKEGGAESLNDLFPGSIRFV